MYSIGQRFVFKRSGVPFVIAELPGCSLNYPDDYRIYLPIYSGFGLITPEEILMDCSPEECPKREEEDA